MAGPLYWELGISNFLLLLQRCDLHLQTGELRADIVLLYRHVTTEIDQTVLDHLSRIVELPQHKEIPTASANSGAQAECKRRAT